MADFGYDKAIYRNKVNNSEKESSVAVGSLGAFSIDWKNTNRQFHIVERWNLPIWDSQGKIRLKLCERYRYKYTHQEKIPTVMDYLQELTFLSVMNTWLISPILIIMCSITRRLSKKREASNVWMKFLHNSINQTGACCYWTFRVWI